MSLLVVLRDEQRCDWQYCGMNSVVHSRLGWAVLCLDSVCDRQWCGWQLGGIGRGVTVG